MKDLKWISVIYKSLVLILFTVISISTNAQKIKSENVPIEVIDALKKEYPTAKIKEWNLVSNQYVASIKDDGSNGKCFITEEGKLIETHFEASIQELPTNINEYVEKEYVGCDIVKCLLIQKPNEKAQYLIEIKKKGIGTGESSVVTFNNIGKLLSRKDPENFTLNNEIKQKTESKKTENTNKKISKKEDVTEPTENKKKEKISKKTTKNDEVIENKDENNPKEKAITKKDNNKSTVKEKTTIKKDNSKNEEVVEKKKKRSKKDPILENEINENLVPALVKKGFQKKFQKIEDVKWFNIKGDTIYWAKCIYREQDCEMFFSVSGFWIELKTELTKETLLPLMSKYLEKYYKEYELVSAVKIQRADKKDSFTIKILELRNFKSKAETTIFFDKLGKLIKTIDAPYNIESNEDADETAADNKVDNIFEKEQDNLNDGTEKMLNKTIKDEELPSNITLYISNNYKELEIKKSVFKEDNEMGRVFEVIIAKVGINQESTYLYFNKEGNFIKSVKEDDNSPKNKVKIKNNEFAPPTEVINSFKAKFAKATDIKWEEGEDSTYIVSYYDKEKEQKSYYSANGTWQKTTTEIDPENVSMAIKAYIEKNYNGYKILTATSIKKSDKKTYTVVNIKHKKIKTDETLEFNQVGKLVVNKDE